MKVRAEYDQNAWIFSIVTGVRFVVVQLYIHLLKFPLKFYFRLNSKLRLPVGLLNCEGSLILTHSGSGLVRRKTVIGINIATSASRSIGNLRWLLDRESVAAICGQASFIVKVERRGFYIHQEIAPGAGAWLVVCHTTLLPWNYHCVVPIFLIWNLKWTVSFEILAAHCRDYLTSRFSDSKWKKKLFFFHYFQCKQCRPDWRTWDFDFPMTTRTFVKSLCGSLWFVCAGVERASREGSSYIYTSSTLTSRWHQRGQALWRTTGPPINLATFLFSILDSKRRLGTFKVFFGLILLILFSFLMALFFDWKVVRVLMVVGLSSPLSKSSFILFYSWCFCTPKAR